MGCRSRFPPVACAALGALAVVAIQSNVDFGVELVGLALPVTAIAATLTYVPMRDAAFAIGIERVELEATLGL